MKFLSLVFLSFWVVFPSLQAEENRLSQIQQVIDTWKDYDPNTHSALDHLWKKAQEEITDEKKLSNNADKYFKDSFEKVFEGEVSPADTLTMIKLFDGLAMGDYDEAQKTGGEFILSKLCPAMSGYVSVMQATASTMDAVIKDWVKDLYDTPAYNYCIAILDREAFKANGAYVPSIWINAEVLPELKELKQQMQSREAQMQTEWSLRDAAHEAAVDDLVRGPWAARLRQALGREPSQQQIFNHFLLHHLGPQRKFVMRRYQEQYLDPMMSRQLRKERKRLRQAMEAFLTRLSQPQIEGLPEGAVYVGDLLDGAMHGQGKVTFANGDSYEGQFVDGAFQGQGTYRKPGKWTYEGSFVKDVFQGQGTKTYANGSVFTGQFEQGRMSGPGKLVYPNGESVEGQFDDGMIQGKGIYRKPGQWVYEGDMLEGRFHGQGTMRYEDGSYYSGGFENGVRKGHGIHHFPNGSGFLECDWNGEVAARGQGVFMANGNTYRGIVDGTNGNLVLVDGTLSEGPPSTIQYHLYTDEHGQVHKEAIPESLPRIDVEMLKGDGPSKAEVDRVVSFIHFCDQKTDQMRKDLTTWFESGPERQRVESLRSQRAALHAEWKRDEASLSEEAFNAKWKPRQEEWESLQNTGRSLSLELNNESARRNDKIVRIVNFRNELFLHLREQQFQQAVDALAASGIPAELGFSE